MAKVRVRAKDAIYKRKRTKIGLARRIKNRKELRKEKRNEKKVKRNEHFMRQKLGPHYKDIKKSTAKGPKKVGSETLSELDEKPIEKPKPPKKKKLSKKQKLAIRKKEKEEEERILRARELQREIRAEDKEIKKLEKDLNLNKRKSKTIPKSFISDGLDYLLEFCDEEKRAQFVVDENSKNLHESESEFEEDFELMVGKKQAEPSKATESDSESDGSDSEDLSSDFSGEEENDESTVKVSKKRNLVTDDEDAEENTQTKSKKVKKVRFEDEMPSSSKSTSAKKDEDAELRKAVDDEIKKRLKEQRELKANKAISKKSTIEDAGNVKKKSTNKITAEEEIMGQLKQQKEEKANSKQSKLRDEEERRQMLLFGEKAGGGEEEGGADEKPSLWEDIYGRTRDKEGNVLPSAKYVPPQLRDAGGKSLLRLQRQMKGLLNRLAESNVKSIASEIEALYGTNSRHDTSQTLTTLVMEAVVAPVHTPDRLVAEHVMLVAIIHANVGSDVGAHLLQAVAKRFDELLKSNPPVEDKSIDNVVLLLAHLYNFNVFNSMLVNDILNLLTETFGPKEIELIIVMFKTIGAKLRKDNPLALKELIGRMQVKAGTIQDVANGSRVRFTMDVLLAIKNNNMSKIPNYDTSHADGLKRLIKSLLRQGNYVSELTISLEDLLKADDRGRWWVVGSAWSGTEPKAASKTTIQGQETFSAQLLELARKQRMNTDDRRTIFCIVMAAEDYIDAFEKLINLKLRTQKEREIVVIILDCCLHEKTFNPYYVHLATKFCICNRKYQMAFQYLVWDKLKELSTMGQVQVNNLAKFLSGMFLEVQGLPLSVLKVIQFATIDKPTVRLVRRTLLSMVLAEPLETVLAAFTRIARVEKLRLFREGLRLFLHHFMLRNTASLPQGEIDHLKERIELADKALAVGESATLF